MHRGVVIKQDVRQTRTAAAVPELELHACGSREGRRQKADLKAGVRQQGLPVCVGSGRSGGGAMLRGTLQL